MNCKSTIICPFIIPSLSLFLSRLYLTNRRQQIVISRRAIMGDTRPEPPVFLLLAVQFITGSLLSLQIEYQTAAGWLALFLCRSMQTALPLTLYSVSHPGRLFIYLYYFYHHCRAIELRVARAPTPAENQNNAI